jgi:ATP-dependent DNA helicase RecG
MNCRLRRVSSTMTFFVRLSGESRSRPRKDSAFRWESTPMVRVIQFRPLGGILLFGKQRTDHFPDSVIRCARFQGSTKERIIDSADVRSPLPSAIDEVITFVERNTQLASTIGRMHRVDTPQYPPAVVREAVINSLLHADYSLKGAQIQIAVFDKRIEITNPGGLPYGQTMKKALSGYSRLRNRVIGRVFRELGLIEQWGSGIPRIMAICEKAGLKLPQFEEQGIHFRTTLYSLRLEKSTLNKFEKALVNHIIKRGAVQTKEAAAVWKISDRQARTRLGQLVDRGILVRISTSPRDPRAVFVLSEEYPTRSSLD